MISKTEKGNVEEELLSCLRLIISAAFETDGHLIITALAASPESELTKNLVGTQPLANGQIPY